MKIGIHRTLGSTIALAALNLALVMANAHAALITENYSAALAVAYNYANDNYVTGPLSANTGDGFSASFSPSFVSGPSGATFSSGSVNLAHDGVGSAYVYGYLVFTVDANVTYSISGSLSGVATGGNNVPSISAYLLDTSTSYKYYEVENESSANLGSYAFTLGDGLANYVLGSASGTLSPGTYEIYFAHELYGAGAMDGVGDFIFTLTDAAAVPEPSTYLAGALLVLPFGASAVRRLRNRKQVS